MADERNFRTYYYEKFGFRTVEEKRSIEILLKEQPLNVEKLFQFCWRFPVPSMYRVLVWKFLLGKSVIQRSPAFCTGLQPNEYGGEMITHDNYCYIPFVTVLSL